MSDRVVAVVATRNEPNLPRFVSHLCRYADYIVVADESDTTDTMFETAGMKYVRFLHADYGGIGPSVIAGMKFALDRMGGVDRIVTLDAGGSHNPRDINRLLACDHDVVVGSRFLPLSSYTGRPWRAACSRAYSFRMSYKLGYACTDWTSGFRAYTRQAAEYLTSLEYSARMHGFHAEVLARACEAGMEVAEVPIAYTAGVSALRWSGVREAWAVR